MPKNDLQKLRFFIFLVAQLISLQISFGQSLGDSTEISLRFDVKEDILQLPPRASLGSTSSIGSGIEENTFTSPLSIYVVTRKEIEYSGVKNIPEAFRLIPGCFVSERTKSNFDVHLTNSMYIANGKEDYVNFEGRSAIVLVDGVPLLQRLDNGIWSELLPNIQSVEQIEVILSPMSALHGQALAGGVINIITRKVAYDSFRLVGDLYTDQTLMRGASIFGETLLSNQLSIKGNIDFGKTTRNNDSIFFLPTQTTIGNAKAFKLAQGMYEDMEMAQQYAKMGLVFNYEASSDFGVQLSASYLESLAQSNFQDLSAFFMVQRESQVGNLDLRINWNKLKLYTKYKQSVLSYINGVKGTNFHVTDFQAKLERDFIFGRLRFRPGFFFNHNLTDNLSPKGNEVIDGLPGMDIKFSNLGAYIHLDARLSDKTRGIAISSYEYYPDLDQHLYAHNLALAYQYSPQTIWRASAVRSYYSPNLERSTYFSLTEGHYVFNPSLKPIIAQQLEVGLRTQSSGIFNVDLFAFYREQKQLQKGDLTILAPFENYDAIIKTKGITTKIDIAVNKFIFRSFFTLQSMGVTNGFSGVSHNFFGGFTVNYSAYYNKLNLSLSGYLFNSYSFTYIDKEYSIPTSFVPYFNLSYNLNSGNVLYFTAKNFLSKGKREYPFADEIKQEYTIGLRIILGNI